MSYSQVNLNISENQAMTTLNLKIPVDTATNITGRNRWPTNSAGSGLFSFENLTAGNKTFYSTGLQLRASNGDIRLFSDNGDEVEGEAIRLTSFKYKWGSEASYQEVLASNFNGFEATPNRFVAPAAMDITPTTGWYATSNESFQVYSVNNSGGLIELVGTNVQSNLINTYSIGDYVFIDNTLAQALGCDAGIMNVTAVDGATNYSITVNEGYSNALPGEYNGTTLPRPFIYPALDVQINMSESGNSFKIIDSLSDDTAFAAIFD